MSKSLEDRIRESRILLGNPYAYLAEDGGFDAALPRNAGEGADQGHLRISPDDLLAGKRRGSRFTRDEIDEIVRRLHRFLWEQRSLLVPRNDLGPLDVVDPRMVLNTVGFQVIQDAELGDIEEDGAVVGVAGLLDRDSSCVRVSPRFPAELQRFTLAHELGHVLLHEGSGLHRDRALDGSRGGPSSPQEAEANYFAAAFLMPAKLVRAEFEQRFSTQSFVLDRESAFGLGLSAHLKGKRVSRFDVCRLVATAEHYHGEHFVSLARLFDVSAEAMAIRIRELDLVRG